MSPWKRAVYASASVFALYVLVHVAFFSPVLLSPRLLGPGDAWFQNIAAFYSSPSLWTPLLAGGLPPVADPTVQSWYPPLRLFVALGWGWNAYMVLHLALASAFTFGLVHRLTGSILAGLVSGLVYGLGPFLVARLGHANIVHSAVWLPLVLWTLDALRYRFQAGWFVLGATGVALTLLAGHPQAGFYALALAASYGLYLMWLHSGRRASYSLCLAALMALGALLAAPQMLPTAELASLGPRRGLTFAQFNEYSLPFWHLPGLLMPMLFGGYAESPYGVAYFGARNSTEMSVSMGLVPLLLAALAVGNARHNRRIWYWLGVLVFAVLAALGERTPLARLLYALPGFKLFRVPTRHLLEGTMAISVLSGYAVALVAQRAVPRTRLQRIALATAGAILLSSSVSLILLPQFLPRLEVRARLAQVSLLPWGNLAVGVPLLVLVLGLTAVVVWVRIPQAFGARVLLLGVLALDLGSVGCFVEWRYYSMPGAALAVPPVIARYRRELVLSGQRMLPVDGAFANMSRVWGVPSLTYYGPLVPTRFDELTGRGSAGALVNPAAILDAGNRALDVLAVRYLLMPPNWIGPWSSTAEEDLGIIRLAEEGCWQPMPRSRQVALPPMGRVARLGLVTTLGCSTDIPDGADVLKVTLLYTDGTEATRVLKAGRDTAEGSADCADVRSEIRHHKAAVYDSSQHRPPQGDPCLRHRYVTVLPFDQRSAANILRLDWVGGPRAFITIAKIGVYDADQGVWRLIVPAAPSLGDAQRWLGDARRWRVVGTADRTMLNADLVVYENRRAFPRAWLVGRVMRAGPNDILTAMHTSRLPGGTTFDPATMALVEEPFSLDAPAPPGASATAQVIEARDSRMIVDTNSPTPAFLVLSDMYYPGWQATLDGVPTKIFRTDYALRGIAVPAGGHIVRLDYRPVSVLLGVSLSVAALVILAGIAAASASRRRGAAPGGR